MATVEDKKVVLVKEKYIDRAIEKYKGEIDQSLEAVLTNGGLTFTPYVFQDNRVLLVSASKTFGLLYPSKNVLFEFVNLE